MKLIKYLETWFDVGLSGHSEAKYTAGRFYPITGETTAHVARGIAEEVDAPADAEKADAAAEKAEAKAKEATAAADAAKASAAAATAAAELAPAK